MNKRCTQRLTREMIFNDSPRTWVEKGGPGRGDLGAPGERSCNLNNAYALRRGLLTSESGRAFV